MLRLETTSPRSLGLYGVLLVLPTLIFGWLYWRELEKDFIRQREEIPDKAERGADRIVAGMRERLDRLIESESQRPFFHYAKLFSPEDAMGDELSLLPSPIVKSPTPTGILGWFSFDRTGRLDSEIDIFLNEESGLRTGTAERLRPIIEEFRNRRAKDPGQLPELGRVSIPELENVSIPLTAVAVAIGHERDLDCVRKCSPTMRGRTFLTGVSDFRLEFYVDSEGFPRAIASRRVIAMEPLDGELLREAECLKPLLKGFGLHQGFLIDPNWLFKDLPYDIAKQALDEDEELHTPAPAGPIDNFDSVFAEILPVKELGFEIDDGDNEDYGKLEVQIHTERIEERLARQSKRFLAVGFMLVVTLVGGMTLLYRSVRRELDQAHRMQNFVAAVTHELRTPVSTIRLHAEMLLDGWVSPEKQEEYYRRIVRETNRLSTLVERVLEKSRLKENVTQPVPGDLNEHVASMQDDLIHAEGEKNDLAFQLEQKLPPVWLTSEGVSAILSNLVENARKYAPVSNGEPILVRTRWSSGNVLLEVADRGPGVPPSERERIFEAFYRVGSEETRTTTGTGLGLHLVRLHAETCGAKVSVENREGGGSLFRVAFRPAD